MLSLALRRIATGPDGTFGRLIGDGLELYTIELPWRNNAHNVSCIPAGSYELSWIRARRSFAGHYQLYLVAGVEDRAGILIHPGNWAGDWELGRRTDSWGCILPGISRGRLAGQRAVLGSQAALRRFHEFMAERPARLEVTDA